MPMIRQITITVCTVLLAIQTVAAQQTQYPATQYNSFSGCKCNNDFATSPPSQPDAPACVNPEQYRAMSPDSWDGAIAGRKDNSNDWPTPAKPIAESKDSSPAQESSPFQSASFGKPRNQQSLADSPNIPKSILAPNSTRYPLQQDSEADDQSSIIRMPAVDVPPAPIVGNNHPDASWGSTPNDIEDPSAFEPNTAYRTDTPVIRNWGSPDNGEKFDFEEKKKEYPQMKEILATGRYFGSATLLYLKPAFQGNTAITEAISGISTPFDFDFEAAPQFQVGFESKYGPGVELNYWQYDESSNPAVFTSDGVESGTTSIWMLGPYRWSRLTASNAGDTLERHSFGGC